ncbi:MAG TPA: chemotaxis protein CheB, partial [Bryobacteraceae bacterium]
MSEPRAEISDSGQNENVNDTPREEAFSKEGLTIVGVGASAGGFEAFSELLKALPVDTGMAFVLVQHLDPHHESILADLLAGRTGMPVAQVVDRTAVEPNHVYVIAPNTTMTLAACFLELSRRPSGESHKPIDTFLLSLAREQGGNSIGVILSGTASDGTLGLKAIKSAGGITFCQDLSAKFDSMPQNAIAAGAVDFVLPPAQIAGELATIARHPYYIKPAQFAREQDGPVLQKVLRLLRVRTGVDFNEYKEPTIQRRLLRRMALRKCDNLEKYLCLLEEDERELECLFDDFLINVTEFFRDPEVFESLKRMALPSILKDRKDGETIRVWVPGCSSGEEVYSIAIAILEALDEQESNYPIRLFGTDVSDRIIDQARAGRYSESVVSTLSPERLRRFFVNTDGGYQISRAVREMCIFSRHDIIKDPPLSRMDLVSCRNLLIYLTPSSQNRVISRLGYALQPGGCLLLGTSETLGPTEEYFEPLDPKHKIFCLKPGLRKSAFQIAGGMASEPAYVAPFPLSPVPLRREREDALDVQRYVDRILLSQFGPNALIVNRHLRIVEVRGDMSRFLVPSAHGQPGLGEPNPNLFLAVRDDISSHLR